MDSLMKLNNEFFKLLKLKIKENSSKEETDTDKLCFQTSLQTFLKRGRKDDAFSVYFCYAEIFNLFGSGYENTKKLLETLSDHEYHSGELLSKHRDHYSHSVYVFSLGLAIYANDKIFRDTFNNFYNLKNDMASYHFLKMWGMVSLFHDIGYPFQLAQEQIQTYTKELWGDQYDENPFVSYGNLDKFLAIDNDTKLKLQNGLNTSYEFNSIDDIFAYGLKLREGYDDEYMKFYLRKRAINSQRYVDHAYYSAIILVKQLFSVHDFEFNLQTLDILTAILLHNSINKYKFDKNTDIPNRHPISIDEHPLSYLLLLCDELQDWDRFAYGKVSKHNPLAWDIDIKISDNYIWIEYFFDKENIIASGKIDINKHIRDIQDGVFVSNIYSFINSSLRLEVKFDSKQKVKKTHMYASDDNFINLCDFAQAIHESYGDKFKNMSCSSINEKFGNLSLQFKLSNIEQAKSYAEKLELVNCFYSNKDLDYDCIDSFNDVSLNKHGTKAIDFLAREEHMRWVKEKINLGWIYGVEGIDYHTIEERNKKKMHKCIAPYDALSEEDQNKDKLAINNIVKILQKFDSGIKIYNYRDGGKESLQIAVIGQRNYNKNELKLLKNKIKEKLKDKCDSYRVIVRSTFDIGGDQLFAECANELGLTTKAYLPLPYEKYIISLRENSLKEGYSFNKEDELKMRHLLAQTAVCRQDTTFKTTREYIISKCDLLILLWDGETNKSTFNKYIEKAKDYGLYDEDIIIIKCHS
ncbi:MAG: hypothetical protein J1F32_01260 [Erysipelotrichales bacterium]|nr:hypothetical protein [Erysipelotrichales bacterium]